MVIVTIPGRRQATTLGTAPRSAARQRPTTPAWAHSSLDASQNWSKPVELEPNVCTLGQRGNRTQLKGRPGIQGCTVYQIFLPERSSDKILPTKHPKFEDRAQLRNLLHCAGCHGNALHRAAERLEMEQNFQGFWSLP